MNRQIFEAYVETQLAPTLKPGDMVKQPTISSQRPAIPAKQSRWAAIWIRSVVRSLPKVWLASGWPARLGGLSAEG